MPSPRKLPPQKRDSHRSAAHLQKKNERLVELSIRGAEVVRILAALSEEFEEMVYSRPTEEIQEAADAVSVALAETVLLGAQFTQKVAAESVRRFNGQECLATRCAILSSKDAARIAHDFVPDEMTGT